MIILKNFDDIYEYFKENHNIIFPTETVYGLGSRANDNIGIENIYKIKNRPKNNPLIIHFYSIEEIQKYTIVKQIELELLRYFTPGPLTILLKKKHKDIFKLATNNSSKICCRIPNDFLTLELIKNFGPIAGPSCNFSQKLTITKEHMLREEYKNIHIGVFLNDENVKGIESTIIEVSENDLEINILREGIVTKTNIVNFLNKNNFNNYIVNISSEKKIIPGNYFPHYQINKPLSIFDYKEENSFHISYGNEICDFNLSTIENIEEIIKNYYYSLFLGDLSDFKKVTIKPFPFSEEFSSLHSKLKKSLNKNS